jgi:hypothetical protein
MANENTTAGHVVLPVLHPTGEVHNIAVPEDTNLKDLHSALIDEYAHSDLGAGKQPTADGALENDPAFKESARKAWSGVSYGDLPQEAGFVVGKDGKMGPTVIGKEIGSKETTGSTTFHLPPEGAFATLHTHPRPSMNKNWVQQPSQPDIDVAKREKQNVYVVTSSGLWLAQPDGSVVHVFNNNDWMREKKKK